MTQGEIVAVKGGYILTTQQWTALAQELGAAEIQIAEDLFIAPVHHDQREGCMVYTNHSCEPNIAIQGQIVFVAMRDIAPGEELTHDWATTYNDTYEMQCHCGARNCRGVPSTVHATLVARQPSKIIRVTMAPVAILKFGRCLIGARNARAALTRWPFLIVFGTYPMPSWSIPLRSS